MKTLIPVLIVVVLMQLCPSIACGQSKSSYKVFLSKLSKGNLNELKNAKYINKICWATKYKKKICALEIIFSDRERLIITEEQSADVVLKTPLFANISYGFEIFQLVAFEEALKFATTSTEIIASEILGKDGGSTIVVSAHFTGFDEGDFPWSDGYQGSIFVGENGATIGTIDELVNGGKQPNSQSTAEMVEGTLKKSHADFYAYGINSHDYSFDLEWRLNVHDWKSGPGLRGDRSGWEITKGIVGSAIEWSGYFSDAGSLLGPGGEMGGAVLGAFVGPVVYLSDYAYESSNEEKSTPPSPGGEGTANPSEVIPKGTTTTDTPHHVDANSPKAKDNLAKKTQLLGECVDRSIVVNRTTRQKIINSSSVTVQNTTEDAKRGVTLGALHIPRTRLVIDVDPNVK